MVLSLSGKGIKYISSVHEVCSVEEVVENTWLSARENELVEKHYYQGLNLEVTAEEMDITSSTARTMKDRIKKKKEKSQKTLDYLEEAEKS